MRLGDALAREYPDANHGLTIAVTSLQDDVVGPARAALMIMFAAVDMLAADRMRQRVGFDSRACRG